MKHLLKHRKHLQLSKMRLQRVIILLWVALLPMVGVGARKPKPVKVEEPVPVEETDTMDIENDDFESLTEGMPVGVLSRLVGDTLFVNCTQDELPRFLVVMTDDGECQYRLMPAMLWGDTSRTHPADSVYNTVWINTRVNPYQVAVDSMRDSIPISLKGFTYPLKDMTHLTSKFGFRRYRFHYGTDIKVQVGDSIRASWDGQVRIVGWDPRGYGYYVLIRHDNGLETIYGHLSRPLVEENERIFSGEVLGLGGNTGRSTGSHLHYEIRYLGNAIDPATLVDFDHGKLCVPEDYLITKKGTFRHNEEVKQLKMAQYHKVRQGDTLSGIARRYHTTVRTLCRLNNIKETSILRLGQRIRVR